MIFGVKSLALVALVFSTVLDSTTAQIQCKKLEAFNLAMSALPFSHDERSLTTYLDLKIVDGVLPAGVKPIDYIVECLDRIEVSLKVNNVVKFTQVRKVTANDQLKLINVTFANLDPVTEYFADVSYFQQRPTEHSKKAVSDYQLYSCFGRPSAPTNLKATLNALDGSVTVTWTKPTLINAPDICYYTIQKRVSNDFETIEAEVKDTSYKVRREVVQSTEEIRVVAYNDGKCYGVLFEQCFPTAAFSDVKLPASTTVAPKPTTSKPGRASSCVTASAVLVAASFSAAFLFKF